jgi:hypothetical protein
MRSKAWRRSLAAAAVLALLVGLYAAAGYWLAPGYLRDALVEAARSRGLELEVASVRTQPFALRAALGGLVLSGAGGRAFAEAESVEADLAWASLWRPGWIVQELRIHSPELALGRLPESARPRGTSEGGQPEITIRSLRLENGRLHAPPGLALEAFELRGRDLSTLQPSAGAFEAAARIANGGGQLQAQANVVWSEGELALQDVSVKGDALAYAGIELRQAMLNARKVPLWPSAPFEAAAQASLAPLGTIAAQGRVGLSPLELRLELDAKHLPLVEAKRWLPRGVAIEVASGTLSAAGSLQLSAARVAFAGSAAVRDLRLNEGDSGALLLAWKEAQAGSLRFDSSPLAIEAGEIVLREPQARLMIERDGAVNFVEALGARGEGGETEGLRASFERLSVERGVLQFADRSLARPFEATIGELSGTVAGFSTARHDPARVRLNGRVQPYGTARIRGTINLNAPAALADISAVFRNLQLEAFNPYVARFAGYRVASGRLSAELRYQVREGRLAGSNRLVFQNLQLGEKLEDKGLLDLPLELAVALLADPQGRIDLAIPVRGDLKDPQFDLGAIVARALGNVVQNLVSAPFRALASLFGAGAEQDPGAVGFAPGSARLSPPAEETVARVAGALEQRPQLGIEVRGGYDPARDRQALGLRAAREALASEAGATPPLDLSDAEVVRAAERLFLERGGDRASLRALRESGEPYGRLLLQSLAASVPLDEGAAEALARERAEAVRAALLEHGVDPARVGLAAPQESANGAQVPTALALRPAGEIAASGTGMTSPRPAPPADPVRAAQQALNAAGFDAGPADGILGPRTKRALIIYQATEGLELTGELDASTRERLL